MKKLILIPILLFSLFLFSQTKDSADIYQDQYRMDLAQENKVVEDTQLEKVNKSLKIKIDSLQKDIINIKNTLRLKTENTELKVKIDSLKAYYQKIIIEIESNINKKANIVSLEKIKNSLESKIDAANFNINNNNARLDDQGVNIQTTSGKVEKNDLHILLSFLLGFLLLITCIVIYKLTSKNKTNISSTKGSIKEILKLDNDLKNILEKHTKILESNTGGDSQKETLKSLKIVADEIMTMENNIYQMTDEEQNSRGLKRIKRAIKNLRNNYKTMGYDIPMLLGTEWKEGDVIEIISELPDENIEKGKRIITRVVTPRIDFKGEMIQRAKVELKSNI